MKKVSLTLFILMINPIILTAQHYQTVYSHRIAYFDNQAGNVKCIRVDSVIGGIDSVFFPFSTIQQTDYSCFTPYGPSWIGEKVIVNDSMNLFFNQKNDTIRIKTDALPEKSWIAYELVDSIKIVATVTGFDTLTFLGQTDSVKTIGFQVYDKTMAPVQHAVNDLTIAISKHFGLVKTVNFILFPNFEYSFLYENLEEFNLIGLSKPEVVIQNLTWFEVYDFQVGDEIHVYYEKSCWGSDDSYTLTQKTIAKYLSRIDYPDSIVYEVDFKFGKNMLRIDTSTFELIEDTRKNIIRNNSVFDKLPGEPIITDNYEAFYYLMDNDSIVSKTEPSVSYGKIWAPYESCWVNCCADGCMPSYTYIKGLGGPYYWCDNYFFCLGGEECSLVYYKKGGKTWGTPLIISDIPDVKVNGGIEIYPNPAKGKFWIRIASSSLPAAFELIDLKGKTLLQKEINTELTPVIVDYELHGFYLYRIIQKSEIIHYGKLLIE
jgi:hypothetical protein